MNLSEIILQQQDLSEQFRTQGYFVLPSAITAEHLDLLRRVSTAAVNDICADMDRKGTDVLGINHRGKRYFVGQAYRNHPSLGDFLRSDLMATVARIALGDTVFLHNDQFVIKMGKAGMSFSWHQDGAYVQARIGDHPECITCWCPLDDVSEENGTVYLLPVERFGKRELVEHVKDPATNDRVGYFGEDPGDPIVAPAGSIVVFSSLVFHRSGPNPTGRQRRAYLAQYAPAPIVNKAGEFPQYFAEPLLENGQRV